MDTKTGDQFLAIEATIETNKQESDNNHKKTDEKLTLLTENQKETNEKLALLLTAINKNKIYKSYPAQKDTTTPPDPTTTVQTNRKAPPLEGVISENIGGMWNLKHEISSQRFYELLIKIEFKGDTALDLKNFYNHVKMSLNAVTKLREHLLPYFLSIKQNNNFKE